MGGGDPSAESPPRRRNRRGKLLEAPTRAPPSQPAALWGGRTYSLNPYPDAGVETADPLNCRPRRRLKNCTTLPKQIKRADEWVTIARRPGIDRRILFRTRILAGMMGETHDRGRAHLPIAVMLCLGPPTMLRPHRPRRHAGSLRRGHAPPQGKQQGHHRSADPVCGGAVHQGASVFFFRRRNKYRGWGYVFPILHAFPINESVLCRRTHSR